jgi:beta-mannosidase
MSDANGDAEAQKHKPQLQSWMPVKEVPSVVHSELIVAGVIPHPYLGQNERLVQWVGNADWEYSVTFSTPEVVSQYQELVFEGLDTVAIIKLNGVEILKSDNMFLPARVDVKDRLRRNGQVNELTILFESAEKVASAREAEFGVLKPMVMRGTKRVHLRKAQVSSRVRSHHTP